MSTSAPRLLVVPGGQKCGTTSLYHDLAAHPSVEVLEKEAEWAGEAPPPGTPVLASVSTTYTIEGPVEPKITKVVDAFGSDLRVLFISRDPIERLASHYRHESARRPMPSSAADAVAAAPELIENGRLAHHVNQWLAAVPVSQLLVVRLSDMTDNRAQTFGSIANFVGIANFPDERVGRVTHSNPGDEAVAVGPIAEKIRSNVVYRNVVRPLLSSERRTKLMRKFLPRAETETLAEVPVGLAEHVRAVADADYAALISAHPEFDRTSSAAALRY